MKTLKEKQLDFLNDTVKHFNLSNRGISKKTGSCSYQDGCAIGRHIDVELCKGLDSSEDFNGSSVASERIFDKLPDNLKELTQDFLNAIQILHDDRRYWSSTGLSGKGQQTVSLLKEEFDL